MPNWLRWTLVLPAAIGSYVAIQIVVGISSEQMPLPAALRDWYSQAVNVFAAPWVFVMAGARTAPERRVLPTAIGLAVVFSLFTGVVSAFAIMATTLDQPLWWLLLSGVVSVAIVVITCLNIFREDHHQRERSAGVMSPTRSL